MSDARDVPPVPADGAENVSPPPTPAVASSPAPVAADGRPASEAPGADTLGSAPATLLADTSGGEATPGTPAAAPPRPVRQALGYGLIHLLAMGAVLFVLVGLAPRVEDMCERLQFDERTALTEFVFDTGYFVRRNWFLAPLLLLFDLGILMILRRSFDPSLARNYTTLVVAGALLLSLLFGYGMLEALTALHKRHL
jgi:hypothetical protein